MNTKPTRTTTTKRPAFTKTTLLVSLAATAALSLSACVAPNAYGPYGSQPQYGAPAYAQPSYAQPAYTQPSYAQPDYSQPGYPQQGYQSGYSGYSTQYGTIAGIRPIGGATGPSGVAGTVVGALVGGVLGNQIGRGHGRDAATVIGALGGAVAGNQIGQQMGAQPSAYRVDVQLSDGSMRSLDLQTPGDLRPGDRVRIDGNQISRY
ncbi:MULTISPECIES: glycine zipper 2TM domain-containing protein [unclassified Burkholderia]|uniref:glycine zipper 2TM domain-containing protein n=1 Tax=unclassified Burkholderia TaxID=2613784 RepID=UPI000756491D|nr:MULTISPECIES: glycine zipper 2TM domain-containing protein [unclassified Burkholderia]KVN20104.1 hypothetical protein WT08_29110 [Burkholderia sp. MSMB1552]KWZ49605.1 hypothetical protein WS92_19100 [Burkholderia sp. MSMB1588]